MSISRNVALHSGSVTSGEFASLPVPQRISQDSETLMHICSDVYSLCFSLLKHYFKCIQSGRKESD